MSQFLLVETGLLPSHTRSSFTATVYHDFLRKEGQFRPSVSDLQLDFKDHWKSILKATSSITSLLPLAIRDNTLYPTASLAIRDYALYLASADRDDPSLAHTSNWKPLDRFTDQELMELIKLCLRQRRPLRTALMTGTQVSWLRDEWEREVRQRELERLRHLEVTSLLRKLIPNQGAEIPTAESQLQVPTDLIDLQPIRGVTQGPPAYNQS